MGSAAAADSIGAWILQYDTSEPCFLMETVERPRKSLKPAAIVTFRDPDDDSAIAERLNVRIKLEPPRLQTKPVVDSKRTQEQRQAPRLMRTWPRAPVSTWCQSHKSVPTIMHFDRAALVSADKLPLQAASNVYNDNLSCDLVCRCMAQNVLRGIATVGITLHDTQICGIA